MAAHDKGCREPVEGAHRLLLVEDDAALARGIEAALLQSSYAVTVAPTAADALDLARTEDFDIGVLDLGLPDRDGIDLLADLRSQRVVFPILVLSARDALNDRIRGLDTGADDYLVKPFALGELEARLRALLRRKDEHGGWKQLGGLRFDVTERRALIGDEDVDLTAREVAILDELLSKARKVVSKQALFDAVFPVETESAPNALEVHVSRLRHKLAGAGVTIRSVRGLGYRLEEGDA
ncbi:MAG TPA: response regulator transcription factor [Burkholderiales bacterium]|nr:response regulator transcription factor [Burkholderiales bacterium]